MENFPKADEICKIIATCKKCEVSTFELGNLKVVFSSAGAREALPLDLQVPQAASPTPEAQVPGQTIQAQQRLEEESHEEQAVLLREQQIAEMIIEDPLRAEELMEDGELEPIGESTDGSSSNETVEA